MHKRLHCGALALPGLLLCLLAGRAGAQAIIARSTFPGTAGADLGGTAATTGGTWARDTSFSNNLLLDGSGGVYAGGGNGLGTYKLPVTPGGTVTLEADVYVAGTLAAANGTGVTLDAYDSSGQEHGYKGVLYYETNQANALWFQKRVDSSTSQPNVGTHTTPSLVAGSYYHIQYSLSPGSEVLRVGPAQTGITTYPYAGTYTTVSAAADSTYAANGPVGVGDYAYVAATATGGLHLLNFLATVPSPPRVAASYYVDPASGLDTNAGTSPGAAWQTLAKATANVYGSGDRLYLKGGTTLAGSLTFSAQPPSLIGSYGAGQATVSVPAASDGFHAQDMTSGCALSNLNFTGPLTPANMTSGSTVTFGARFLLASAGTYANDSVTDCTFSGFAVGIQARSNNAAATFSGLSIEGNAVHDCPGNGIMVRGQESASSGRSTVYIGYNTIYNIPGASYAVDGDTNGMGICCADAQYSVIENNVIHATGSSNTLTSGPGGIICLNYLNSVVRNNEAYGLQTGSTDGCAFDLDGGCQYDDVYGNYSHGNAGCGLFICNFSPFTNAYCTFHHNVSVNDAQTTGGSFRVNGTGTGFSVYNNTFVQSNTSTPLVYFQSDGAATTGSFFNNAFIARGGATGFYWAATPSTGVNQVTFRQNDWYSPDGSLNNYAAIGGQVTQTTFAGLQSLGYEAGNTLAGGSASPGFAASAYSAPPNATPFHPEALRLYDIASGSGAVGAGLPLATLGIAYPLAGALPPSADFHGQPLQPVPDIGAVTYPPAGYPAPAAAPLIARTGQIPRGR